LRSVLTQDKIVFTHGSIKTALSTAHLFSHLSETINASRSGSCRRAAALPEKCKAKDSAKRPNSPKFGFSYENFTTQSFSVLPTPFRLFLGIQQNQCFAACQRHHLCDDVFSTDFGAVIRTATGVRGGGSGGAAAPPGLNNFRANSVFRASAS